MIEIFYKQMSSEEVSLRAQRVNVAKVNDHSGCFSWLLPSRKGNCFHKRVSRTLFTERGCVSQHVLGQTPPLVRHPLRRQTPLPGRHPRGIQPPPSRQLLRRTVCILLDCILVISLNTAYLVRISIGNTPISQRTVIIAQGCNVAKLIAKNQVPT